MTPDCIAPPGAQLQCDMRKYKDHYNTYMHCHRFDQAFWNLYTLADLYGAAGTAVTSGFLSVQERQHLNRTLVQRVDAARHRLLSPLFKRSALIRKGAKVNEVLTEGVKICL